jgi:hypothetical protein
VSRLVVLAKYQGTKIKEDEIGGIVVQVRENCKQTDSLKDPGVDGMTLKCILNRIGGRGWNHVAQNTSKRQALVNTA